MNSHLFKSGVLKLVYVNPLGVRGQAQSKAISCEQVFEFDRKNTLEITICSTLQQLLKNLKILRLFDFQIRRGSFLLITLKLKKFRTKGVHRSTYLKTFLLVRDDKSLRTMHWFKSWSVWLKTNKIKLWFSFIYFLFI